MACIEQLAAMEGENVTLRGWVANKRSSKGLVFIILRDGTGRCQCVADASAISAESFDLAGQLTQESSIEVSGLVLQDERQEGGFELLINVLKIYQLAREYPISKKAHGIEFLMDKRHLCLRSRTKWVMLRIRQCTNVNAYGK